MSPKDEGWTLNGSWVQNTLISIGIFFILLLGLFPQILYPLLANLPLTFEHLSG